MSVLIRDMEMPKSCNDCRFAVDGWCYACPPESEAERKRIVTNYCPLVPVPSHGRLIDADALMRHKGDCYDADGHLLYAVGTGNILCAPTIIEAEEENK